MRKRGENCSCRGRSPLLIAEGPFPSGFLVECNPAIAANVFPRPLAVPGVAQKVLALGVVLCTPVHEGVEGLRDSSVGGRFSVRSYGSSKRTFAKRVLKPQV